LRAVRDGQPLSGGELVKLHPRTGRPWVCDVEVLYGGDEPASDSDEAGASHTKSGPSTIATEAYRDNWERIFRTPALSGGGAGSGTTGSGTKRRRNASLN
jgi:hypothetical protein